MDLTSPHAFWLIHNGVGEVPPPMPRDRRCDVIVVGAGITGALIADALTARYLSVISIDRRHPAHRSTAASTALLQYEIDVHLSDLIEKLGRDRAVAPYRACLEGVRAVAAVARAGAGRRLPAPTQPLLRVPFTRYRGTAQRGWGEETFAFDR
jgi:glycine/D-amino acid oxidase-like deaminating enzyme